MKPMLACDASKELNFPLRASPKLDGIRCLIIDGIAVSRNLKPIRNKYIQSIIGKNKYNGLDGELIVGSPTAHDVYRQTSSGVMSEDGEPEFIYFIFDKWDRKVIYEKLIGLEKYESTHVKVLKDYFIKDKEQLDLYEDKCLKEGYEGLILRSFDSPYKFGRATAKEGYLMKLKRFSDSEAEIIGFEERMHNANEATKDALGHTQRSQHKENLVPMNTLGALIVKTLDTGIEFKIGTGFDDSIRKSIWETKSKLLGELVKFKHFEIGVKEAPRFPVFLGFRDRNDL
jgi:DNA ligase-1